MKKGKILLCLGALFLVFVGLAMVFSASDAQAIRFGTDANHFATRQLLFVGVAFLIGFGALPFLDYRLFLRRDFFWLLVVLTAIALVSVWVPGLADTAHKGSCRWIKLGPISVQPSELARVAVCILYARWCSSIRSRNEHFWKGVVLPLVCLLPVVGLLLRQPDYGSTCLVCLMVFALLYAGGAQAKHLVLVGAIGVVALAFLFFADPEHRSRILSVYVADKVDEESTHQIRASLQAFRRGGLLGVGYGNSLMKEGYLPEAHTDFILAVTGEELGFLFTALVVAANMAVLYGGWLVSRACADRFGKILAFGLTLHLCMASAVNIAVVTKVAPTKGLALPFMSYGGSNMVASFVVLGLLLSVVRHAETDIRDKPIRLRT